MEGRMIVYSGCSWSSRNAPLTVISLHPQPLLKIRGSKQSVEVASSRPLSNAELQDICNLTYSMAFGNNFPKHLR